MEERCTKVLSWLKMLSIPTSTHTANLDTGSKQKRHCYKFGQWKSALVHVMPHCSQDEHGAALTNTLECICFELCHVNSDFILDSGSNWQGYPLQTVSLAQMCIISNLNLWLCGLSFLTYLRLHVSWKTIATVHYNSSKGDFQHKIPTSTETAGNRAWT